MGIISELGLIEAKIIAAAKETADDIYTDIRGEWAVDTGQSKDSIKKEFSIKGYRIYTDLKYSRFIDNIDPDVEYVRRPNSKYPPVDIIEKWVRRKGLSGDNPRQIAFLVARAIAKRGIKNRKIFYRAKIKAQETLDNKLSNI